jgi:hypothetical protein
MASPGPWVECAADTRCDAAVVGDATGWLAAIVAGMAISPTASAAVDRAGVVRCEIFIAT